MGAGKHGCAQLRGMAGSPALSQGLLRALEWSLVMEGFGGWARRCVQEVSEQAGSLTRLLRALE